MSQSLRWISEQHRGMYVHVLALRLPQDPGDTKAPGPKWGYVAGVSRFELPTKNMRHFPEMDDSEYFTQAAAEQAALHNGKRAIDVMEAGIVDPAVGQ